MKVLVSKEVLYSLVSLWNIPQMIDKKRWYCECIEISVLLCDIGWKVLLNFNINGHL